MKKRFLSLALAITMVIMLIPAASAVEPSSRVYSVELGEALAELSVSNVVSEYVDDFGAGPSLVVIAVAPVMVLNTGNIEYSGLIASLSMVVWESDWMKTKGNNIKAVSRFEYMSGTEQNFTIKSGGINFLQTWSIVSYAAQYNDQVTYLTIIVLEPEMWEELNQTTPPTPPTAPNLDTASTWARDGLTAALAKDFTPSDLQDKYQDTITRAEFCRLAVSWVEMKTGKTIDAVMIEKGVSRDPNAFTDTNDQNILAAFALGITSGVGNNQFNPNGTFTREQAAGMILNVGKVIGMDTGNIPPSGFADIDDVSPWCVDGVNFVKANGIMQGDNNQFNPKGEYTREQSILTFNNIK